MKIKFPYIWLGLLLTIFSNMCFSARYVEKIPIGKTTYALFGKYINVPLTGVLPIVVPSDTAQVQVGFAIYLGDSGVDWQKGKFHTGPDIVDTGKDDPGIHAMADGVVHSTGRVNSKNKQIAGCGGFGNYVIIRHTGVGRVNRGNGETKTLYSLYLHLRDKSLVSTGDTVRQGQKIGVMGKTGAAGPTPSKYFRHLHFELRYFPDCTPPISNRLYLPGTVADELYFQQNYEDPHKFDLANSGEGSFPFGWDIDRTQWYCHSSAKLKELGIIGGYQDRSFGPLNVLRRNEFIKMVMNSVERDDAISTCTMNDKLDIPSELLSQTDKWYFDVVKAAFRCINSSTNEAVAFWDRRNHVFVKDFWDSVVTREEAAHILINAAGYSFASQENIRRHQKNNRFIDSVLKDPKDWDKWIYASYNYDIFRGFPDKGGYGYQPHKTLSRAEAAKVICKTFGFCNDPTIRVRCDNPE